jgi:hypothetical protein
MAWQWGWVGKKRDRYRWGTGGDYVGGGMIRGMTSGQLSPDDKCVCCGHPRYEHRHIDEYTNFMSCVQNPGTPCPCRLFAIAGVCTTCKRGFERLLAAWEVLNNGHAPAPTQDDYQKLSYAAEFLSNHLLKDHSTKSPIRGKRSAP